MSISIASQLFELAHPETSGRQYPLSEKEVQKLTDLINACSGSSCTFINGITAVGQLMEQVGAHQEVFRELDALTFSRIGALVSELALMVDYMTDTIGEAEYIRDYIPEEIQS